MNTERICPLCRKPLPPEAVRDLCPECLMKAGFESTAGPARRFVPPTVEELANVFPQLEILELVGQGGMGAVYKARQPGLDRFVALKILPPESTADPGFTERFAREARALARLNHPNIVSVYDFGTAGGLHHFLMEYVEGVNLRQLVRAGRLSPREALEIVPQICDALQFAHDEGIVHRDIKPENIMVDKKRRVKIADFGLAKLLGRDAAEMQLTGAQDVMGTPNYMAPEQIEQPHAVDHRADIYSLGVVFYELLTGELPIGKFAPPSRKVAVDVRLDEVVLHSLEKEPGRRYQHASQVKTDVVSIAQTQGSAPSPLQAASAEDPNLEAARLQVKGPATGLLVTAILNWVGISLIALVVAIVAPQRPEAMPLGVPSVLIPLAALFLSSVIMVAGLKMKRLQNYRLAVLGSILATITTPANLVGLPIGIWSLVVLSQKEVRTMFGKVHPLPRPATAPANPASGGAWKLALVVIAAVMLLGAILIGGALVASMALPALARAKARAVQLKDSAEKDVSMVSLDLLEDGQGPQYLELDGGRTVEPPHPYSTWSRDRKHEWLRETGIDLMIMGNPMTPWKLLTPVDNAIRLVRVPSGAWNGSFRELDSWLVQGPPLMGTALQFVSQGVELLQIPLEGRPTHPDHLFAFETANRTRGLIKVTGLNFGKGDEPIGLKLRFKRLAPGAEASAASRTGAVFGPPKEVAVNDLDEKRGAEALDLDNGRLLDLPGDLENRSESERQAWVEQQGVDLLLDRVDRVNGRWGLLTTSGNELKLASTSDEEWANDQFFDPLPRAAKAVLEETIRRGNWTVYVLSTNAQPPCTFRFATSKGSKGLLQITAFGVKPNYAKMRFKLLSPVKG